MTETDYKGLNNTELTLIHARFEVFFDTLNKNLDNNVIHQIDYTSGKPQIITFNMTDKDVKEFRESDYYKTASSVVEKLSTISGLILATEPGLENKLQL